MKSLATIARVLLLLLLGGAGAALAQTGTNYPRYGWETHLTRLAHGVKGTATILDERTIRLTHFSYDGLAPDMFVYLTTNLTQTAVANGLTMSSRLARPYNNETVNVQLPVGQTLDGWTGISIWCRAVTDSFGWGTFAPPVRPRLDVTRRTNAVEVKLTGEAGQRYWLLGHTNASATGGWQNVRFLTNVTGTVRTTNTFATNGPIRFYRAVRD